VAIFFPTSLPKTKSVFFPYRAAFGNFVIQRLLEYAHTHRDGPDGWPGGFLALLKAFAAHGGFFEAAKEQRGTFVCQRLVSFA
jgi:hypothetical protein